MAAASNIIYTSTEDYCITITMGNAAFLRKYVELIMFRVDVFVISRLQEVYCNDCWYWLLFFIQNRSFVNFIQLQDVCIHS